MQQNVVNTLSAYDDLIENNRRRMAWLEEAARQLYREWFVRLRFPGHEHTRITHGVPAGWEGKALGDICTDVRETVWPEELESGTPYIGLEHIPPMREGSKMPRADWKLMKQYAVAVPPAGLLGSFNGIVESVTEQLKTLTFQTKKLRAARNLLLPRLMSGEIAV